MKSKVQRCRPLLGTFVKIDMTHDRLAEAELQAIVSEAFACVEQVQTLMSFHSPGSEVTRLNTEAHLGPVEVHPWTREVITEALRISELSDGLFDITVAPSLVRWGFLPQMQKGMQADESDASWKDIVIHEDERISFRRPLQIDLGGIAKGFAVDKAAECLELAGASAAVVNAGGDLRFVGARPALLSVRHPASPWDRSLEIPVQGQAAATSAGYFATRWRWKLWRRVTHILHPRTRGTVPRACSATVFAPTCMQADALAKIALLDGTIMALPWFLSEKASAVFADTSGELQPGALRPWSSPRLQPSGQS